MRLLLSSLLYAFSRLWLIAIPFSVFFADLGSAIALDVDNPGKSNAQYP